MNTVLQTADRVEQLIARLSSAPEAREQTEELVRVLMHLYGAGLARITELLTPGELARLTADDLVSSLLIVHDLHPRSTADRIGEALARIRPQLPVHTGEIDLLEVNEAGVVRLGLSGNGHGCPSATAAAERAIESAVLAAAPEVADVRVERRPGEPELLQIKPAPPAEYHRPHCPGGKQ